MGKKTERKWESWQVSSRRGPGDSKGPQSKQPTKAMFLQTLSVSVWHGHTWITAFSSRFWGQSHGSTVPSKHILSYLFNDSQWSNRFLSYEQDVRSNWKMTLIHYGYSWSLRNNWRLFQKLISLRKLTVSLPSSSWFQPARPLLLSFISFCSSSQQHLSKDPSSLANSSTPWTFDMVF